ncbi:methyltransferase domain-containing protein [Thermoleophilia bacterium SCSIO 60948]|nr:methyltransferase domain-containing protein [Thermoleophilia bacterium SCSIO 60948]
MSGEELVTELVELPGGALEIEQPRESAELPDAGAVEWAPMAPYWSVLWRSGRALARELAVMGVPPRVIELGCGLGLPSLVAARTGASVLATDEEDEALELLGSNAARNGIELETRVADFTAPPQVLGLGRFDLALASDLLYERASVAALLHLLPRLAPVALVADPGRPAAAVFVERARERWQVETVERGVVEIHRIEFAPNGERLGSSD